MAETIHAINECGGNVTAASIKLGLSRSTVQHRVLLARKAGGLGLQPRAPLRAPFSPLERGTSGVIDIEIKDGVIVVGSDAHFWPDLITPAYAGFLWALDKFRIDRDLKGCCLNGDVMDCAKISRFPSIGWESKPDVASEIGTVQRRSREIRGAGGEGLPYWWTLGNHDARYETKIANLIPELQAVYGVHLKDHFPDWTPCWLVRVNGGQVVIKHRFRGGIHATYNNVVHAGTTIVTGHLHNANVRPHSDYTGTRWGVDCGTLAAPYGPQFIHYTEGNPVNWRGAFAVLSWYNGRLLQPELALALDEHRIDFRGKVHET